MNIHFPRLVPRCLCVQAERGVRESGRVDRDVRVGVRLVRLDGVEHLEQLALDEVDEHKVDRRVVRHVRRVRRNEVRRAVERQRRVEDVVADARAGLCGTLALGSGEVARCTYVGGDVADRRVLHRAALDAAAGVHLLEPLAVDVLDVAAAVHRALAARDTPLALVRAVVVERREDGVDDARGHGGDVQERVVERRRGQLVVLRERAREDVEPLRAAVRHDPVRDRRARVVDRERDGERLSCEERQEGVVRRVRRAAGTSDSVFDDIMFGRTG